MPTHRYETKLHTEDSNNLLADILLDKHPYGFREIYWKRPVNNVYWDTFDLKSYYDSVNGLPQRKKFRIRWYNKFQPIEDPTLEIKIKSGHVGTKVKKKGSLEKLIKELEAKNLEPTMANSYERRYFQSMDNNFRVTIDTNIRFWEIVESRIDLRNPKQLNGTVIEFKYGIDNAGTAEQIVGEFPLRLTRFSKYCTGLELIGRI